MDSALVRGRAGAGEERTADEEEEEKGDAVDHVVHLELGVDGLGNVDWWLGLRGFL